MSTLAKTMTAIAVAAIGAVAANSKTILEGVHRGEGVVDFKRLGRNLETVAKNIRKDVDEEERVAANAPTDSATVTPVAETEGEQQKPRTRRSGAKPAAAGEPGKTSQRKPRSAKARTEKIDPKPATRPARPRRKAPSVAGADDPVA